MMKIAAEAGSHSGTNIAARAAPAAVFCLVVAVLAGCARFDAALEPARYATWEVTGATGAAGAGGSIDGLPVRSGQIIASESGSAQGLLLTLLLAEPSRYIHAGIVAVEDGEAVVYEAVGVVHVDLWGPPTDAIGGSVRRVSLESFIDRHRSVALYQPPPGVDPARVAEFARRSFAGRTPFDPYFDLRDPTRVYCSEFVAQALVAAGGAEPATLPLTANRSARVLSDWLKVTAPAIIPAGALVAEDRRVALLSREHSAAEIDAYFAVKRELHRRFTPDQRIGNVFSFSRFTGLAFRPDVADFIGTVDREATRWQTLSVTEIGERVVELARREFGDYAHDAAPSRFAAQPEGRP